QLRRLMLQRQVMLGVMLTKTRLLIGVDEGRIQAGDCLGQSKTDDALDLRIAARRQLATLRGMPYRIDNTADGIHQGAIPIEDQQLVIRHSSAPACDSRAHLPVPQNSSRRRQAT